MKFQMTQHLTTSTRTTCGSDDGFQDCISEDEGNELLMKQESLALERRMKTVGIRDGLETGKEETLQQGFDQGYALGAARNFCYGRLRGALGTAVACGLMQSDMIAEAEACMLKLRTLEIDASGHQVSKDDDCFSEEVIQQAEYMLTSLGMNLSTSTKQQI
ncbi:Uncharacterized conserved protein [Plasmopara halstedii]|uniref:Uncharacterized conserved protein n=1 Tax=Plasmopara halstedii TaxID=4781 RepID=A0A0P1AFH0_PLAHL|nr:Uncharacterized conserved protein [Plasmopara halstedii]CEG39705.1 Uncharacterized conserved protein [Plasmopara halstedii]|eukprot:XP_024576074.1 Uncharacterized conserved protein [Plasmopara halstedii]